MEEKTIVIVDDEPRAREGIKRTLTRHFEGAHTLVCFETATEAEAYIVNHPVHLLITDIEMREMNGLELVQALKTQQQEPAVIIVSAYSDFNYAKEALRLNVINYIVKPVSKDELIQTVDQALIDQEKQAKQTLIESYVDESIVRLNEEKHRFSRSIKEAMDYIDSHYGEALTLKVVAGVVHLNPSYLSTLFKDELKISFVEYLTRVRIQQAKRLLLTTDMNVTEIAETVGYQTPKYFNKVFREFEETTPGAYRKSM